jgi:hypothetical protein
MFCYGIKNVRTSSAATLEFTVVSQYGTFVHTTIKEQASAVYNHTLDLLRADPSVTYSDFIEQVAHTANQLGTNIASIDWLGATLLALQESDRIDTSGGHLPLEERKARGAAVRLLTEAANRSAIGWEYDLCNGIGVTDEPR